MSDATHTAGCTSGLTRAGSCNLPRCACWCHDLARQPSTRTAEPRWAYLGGGCFAFHMGPHDVLATVNGGPTAHRDIADLERWLTEAAAPAGLDVDVLALAFVGRNWGWVDWATKEMAMEAEPSDRAREAVWNAAKTLAERYARLLQGTEK